MKINNLLLAIMFGAAVAAGAHPAEAQSADVSILALTCSGCHGRDVKGSGAVPALRGLPSGHLTTQLKAFKTGERPATVMNRLARGYTDEEIAGLATYFSQLR